MRADELRRRKLELQERYDAYNIQWVAAWLSVSVERLRAEAVNTGKLRLNLFGRVSREEYERFLKHQNEAPAVPEPSARPTRRRTKTNLTYVPSGAEIAARAAKGA